MASHVRRIGIFATSTPLIRSPKETDYSYLKSKGLEVYEAPNVRMRTGHTAGSIGERVDALHKMLENPSIDLLMAYWGGANTNELLPHLNYSLFREANKPIIGFSDTSALLLAVHKKCGIRTYMGPAGITFDKPDILEYTFEYMKRVLFAPEKEVVVDDSPKFADDLYFLREDSDNRIFQENDGRKVYKHGTAKGDVVASNLQTLLTLAGTEYFPPLEGKILFIEEAESEDTAMIHRFLTHLSQVVDLNKLAALCIGKLCSQSGFTDIDTEEMIYDSVFGDVGIPIVYNLNFGHTDPLFTIPLGSVAEVDTQSGVIKFLLSD